MTASSKPMVSAIAMAAKRFSSVPRWCTHHLVSRRFLHRATERHNKPLCMNTAAPFGSVHFCHMRASSTASAPSAVGFDNYDHEVKNFKLHVPEYFNFASDIIDVWAEKQTEGKSKLAFWWIDDNRNELKWTFQQLSDLSKRTSNILLGPCQLTPGDRVVVILPRVPEWWLLNIASCRLGVVLIPGTTQLTARDIRHRLLRSGAKCIITDAATANDVDQVIGDCPNVQTKLVVGNSANPRYGWLDFMQLFNAVKSHNKQVQTKSDDPLQIYFTSGTTGEPKMTQQTHSSYGLASLITGKYWLDLTPSDIHWNLSDTGWAKSAWSSVFAPWTQGACVFVHHSPKFTPQRVLQVLEKYPISTFCATPTAYRMLVLENFAKYNLSSIRHCVSAGEPLNPEVIDQWLDATGTVIREGYGQTETVLQCGSFRCLPNKPGSMGKPAPGMDVRVIGEDGLEVGSGIEGDLAIRVLPDRPVGLFSCYVDEPEKTASTYQGDYYLTGDRAYRDDDGYMWFVGRSDDIILSAGYRIGPFEVESALLEHPAVVESAVVSSPHTTRGEVVKAYVVLMTDYQNADKEALTSELQQLVKDITAPYKYPRKIEFIESLPKTISGKIRRVDLRSREWRKQQ